MAIAEIIVHQTQGQTVPGREGLRRTAEYHIGENDPARGLEGRGWPGIGYTFYVPFTPELTPGPARADQRPIIYRCHADEVHSYHTHTPPYPSRNSIAVGVAFQGLFRSKSAPGAGRPSEWQRAVFEPLLDYLAGRYNLSPLDVFGHSDFGKRDCPGFELDDLIDLYRANETGSFAYHGTWKEHQAALAAAGFLRAEEVDGAYGPITRHAIERLERAAALPETGLWSRPVETLCHQKEQHR